MDASDRDSCWEWKLRKDGWGYGKFKLLNAPCFAHRISWIIHNGEIPEGMFVLHRCDNPPCVNPDHLFLGTILDNTTDMIKKGRQRKISGEDRYNAKLTEDQVKEIRSRHKEKGFNNCHIAKEFGVSEGTVRGILTRRKWKHI